MPQAIWTGTISFGLVSVPVRLYPAIHKKDVRFHELDRLTGQRVRHQRVRPEPLPFEPLPDEVVSWPEAGPATGSSRSKESRPAPAETAGREVAAEEIVKGFEVTPGRYVTVSRQELDQLSPEKTRTIDIEQFVEASAIDPLYYEASYYVVPASDHVRSFRLLLDAMQRTGKAAICWIVLRRKRHLAALRPHGGLMVLTTMLHSDEILPATPLEPEAPAGLTKKEREMAELLIDTLSGPFEPEGYRDEYRQRLTQLIQGRAASAQPASQPAPTGGRVQDLMAALRASVERARQQTAKPRAKPATRRRRRKSA